jgi:hypothetical protein
MTIDGTTMGGIEFAIQIELRVEKESPVYFARLNKSIEPGTACGRIPYVLPVTGLIDEVIKIGIFTKTLGDKSNTEVVIGVFKQA